MKRGSKKKTYKRKNYKRKTNRGKTYKRKTYKKKNVKSKKRKSLKGGLKRLLESRKQIYDTEGKLKYEEDLELIRNKMQTGTDEEGDVRRQMKINLERGNESLRIQILKAITDGQTYEEYKAINSVPERKELTLQAIWNEVLQTLGNKVNDICRIVGFDEGELKILTEDSLKRETNIRNILIGIDHIIQYQLDNPGASDDYLGYGMMSSFVGQ